MSWKRILLFVAVGMVATFIAGFPFGFIAGFFRSQGEDVPMWVPLGQALAVPMSLVLVFAILAFVQKSRTAAHVFVLALLLWGVSFPLNVLLLGQPFVQWALGAVVMVVTAGLGLGAGLLGQMIVGSARETSSS